MEFRKRGKQERDRGIVVRLISCSSNLIHGFLASRFKILQCGLNSGESFLISCFPDSSPLIGMPRFRETIPVDDYVFDVLMRDVVGQDRRPAAYLVYLYLYGLAARTRWKPVVASLRRLAEATGLSTSAVQSALELLRRRELIETGSDHATAVPEDRVLRHWRHKTTPRRKTSCFYRRNNWCADAAPRRRHCARALSCCNGRAHLLRANSSFPSRA